MKKRKFILLFLLMFVLTACRIEAEIDSDIIPLNNEGNFPTDQTATPFQPIQATINPKISVFVPEYLQKYVHLSEQSKNFTQADNEKFFQCNLNVGNGEVIIGNLTFVVVRPFNSIDDTISSENLLKITLSEEMDESSLSAIYVNQPTHQILSGYFGELSSRVIAVSDNEIFNNVDNNPNSIGIIGFENLEPIWKVLKIDDVSPLEKNFNQTNYMLNFPISINCFKGNNDEISLMEDVEYFSNRDEDKLSIVMMSGTTALTRATASRMEAKGNTYPGEAVKIWFDQSDFRHVSSETPFFDDCPFPNPYQLDLSFCSEPDYVELFEYLGVNIIELTGNHLLDKGNQAFESTLSLFSDSGFSYFAGGITEEEALKPLVIEHNGNKVAFIGCNLAGPANVWAGMERSGIAYCDFDAMKSQIQVLAQSGYLPIVTFQYFESNFTKPSPAQIHDFRRMIDAGAIIVSGSQSHVPMTMEIYQNGFIHYGLGNLFFDQMDNLANRKEFIDRHIFYNGKYISTELLTAKLEDYAKPVPMTDDERADLLNEAFSYFTYSGEGE